MSLLKRLLVGRPLATAEEGEQRLPKLLALPTFSADAISSTAYATEEILVVLVAGSSSLALALAKLVPISLVVAGLLVVVVASYRQTIFAYPNGGGSYIVSRENLGRYPSLVAAAALLIDYVLTVAVSISAGVAAIVSLPALSGLASQRVLVALVAIAVITIANLRGIRQSGALFAIPTYTYVTLMAALVIYGLGRTWFGHIHPVAFDQRAYLGARQTGGTLGLFLLLKGFSSGAIALTGVEAISNGVPAFKQPEPKNAAATLVWMGTILGTLFVGVSVLAHHLRPYPSGRETVLSELARTVFGRGPVYTLLQFATAAILTLAANTSYADFPRLSSIVARDGFLPRRLARRGDRLVFSNGIIVLAVAAAVLITVFGGRTDALIPLYAVGVFTAFTLSQAGMVRHHLRLRQPGWRRALAVNAVGAAATGAVLIVIASAKFLAGAWIPIVLIPVIIAGFVTVRRYYDRLGRAMHVSPGSTALTPVHHTFVVLVGQVHLGVLNCLNYARGLHPEHLVAVHICGDTDDGTQVAGQWHDLGLDVPLDLVASPYRDMTAAIESHVGHLLERWPGTTVTVVASQYAGGGILEDLVHNQALVLLRERLMIGPGTAVVTVPYRIMTEASELPAQPSAPPTPSRDDDARGSSGSGKLPP